MCSSDLVVLDDRCAFATPVTGFVSGTPETDGRRVRVRPCPDDTFRVGRVRKVADGTAGERDACELDMQKHTSQTARIDGSSRELVETRGPEAAGLESRSARAVRAGAALTSYRRPQQVVTCSDSSLLVALALALKY